MKVITIANQKGGVGKSSTANALIGGLRERGYKVLAVDLDGQCNLTIAMGASTNKATILGAMLKETTAENVLQHTEQGDVLPANNNLANADAMIGNVYCLKEALEPLKDLYDFCIIDTPPALCARTSTALIASDSVVIPARADLFSIQGIDQLTNTIVTLEQHCKKEIHIAGILLTAYKSRAVLHNEVLEPLQKMADNLETSIFKTTIRDAVAISEAPFLQKNLFTYAPKAKVTEDYREFITELLERLKQ